MITNYTIIIRVTLMWILWRVKPEWQKLHLWWFRVDKKCTHTIKPHTTPPPLKKEKQQKKNKQKKTNKQTNKQTNKIPISTNKITLGKIINGILKPWLFFFFLITYSLLIVVYL